MYDESLFIGGDGTGVLCVVGIVEGVRIGEGV